MALRYYESEATGIVVAQMEAGDLLLECLRDLLKTIDMHTGIVMTGIGSLSRAHIHTVLTNVNPVEELYLHIDGPLEVTNFFGLIANYEPHVHLAMCDPQMKFYGGHLEEGCEILTLSEITLMRIPDLKLHRRIMPERSPYPYRMLDVQK